MRYGCKRKEQNHNDRHRGGETVETVRKIRPVNCSENGKEQQRNRQNTDVKEFTVRKGNHHIQRDMRHLCQIKGKDQCDNKLKDQLLPCDQTVGSLQYNFQIIIDKSDRRKTECHPQDRNIARLCRNVEQADNQDRCQKDQTAHRRGPGFFKVRLNAFNAFRLSHFKSGQQRDKKVSCNQADRNAPDQRKNYK